MTEREFTTQHQHITRITMAWGEMDALGHVNNIVYFRYMETARINYFATLGLSLATTSLQIGPIVAQIECQFRSAITFPDEILVSSHFHHLGTTSLKMQHKIFSTAQSRIVADGDSVLVMVDYATQRKIEIPMELKRRIADLP